LEWRISEITCAHKGSRSHLLVIHIVVLVRDLRKFAFILLDGDNLTGYGHNVGSIFRKYLFPFWYTELQTETYIKACSGQLVIEEVQ
jgi:hypothetical protein